MRVHISNTVSPQFTEVLSKVKELLLRDGKLLSECEGLGLWGSLVRGDWDPQKSDIDVYVIVSPQANLSEKQWMDLQDRWAERISEILSGIERPVTALVFPLEALRRVSHWDILDMASDSLLLYDKGKVRPLFDRIVAKAKEVGLVRKLYGLIPTWELGRPIEMGEVLRIEVEDKAQ